MAKSSGSPVSRLGLGEKSVSIVVDLHRGRLAADRRAGRAVGEQQLAELALGGAVGSCSPGVAALARSLAIWSWRICSASMPEAAM